MDDPLHQNAKDYFKYFLDKSISVKCSTISVAEYCVRGNKDHLPLAKVQILPFNFHHGVRAGELAKIVFSKKKNKELELSSRLIISNDTKLFSQADTEEDIDVFISSDREALKMYQMLKKETPVKFEFMDMNISMNETFGILQGYQ